MRAVLQRVKTASVTVNESKISQIGPGLLILLGIEGKDTSADVDWLVQKISKMRIFDDADGKMNLDLPASQGEALVVSQFTLHASTRKGNRPSYIKAARPEHAEPLYEEFCEALSSGLLQPAGRGSFGAHMEVSLVNDGPVTIIIDSQNRE
ncbi:MAG: D-aminoacyl-tRNA deacylase [Akkermansiaceae bacterium]|jgi:D-tyrosyl-tRNA(Tyr) deacylase